MDNFDNYTPEIHYNDEPKEAAVNATEQPAVARRTRNQIKPQTKSVRKDKETGEQKTDKLSLAAKIKKFANGTSLKLITGIFLGCLAAYLLVSFLSYFASCIKDQSLINHTAIGTAGKVANAGGEGGARLSEFLINESFGLGSFVIVLWLGAMSLKLLIGRPHFKSVDFTIKCFVALITVSLIVGLSTIAFHSAVNWGGYHGRYVNEFIMNFIGWTGAFLLCIFMIALFVVICLRDLINWILKIKAAHAEKRRIAAEEKAARLEREQELLRMQNDEHLDDIKAGESVALAKADLTDIPENDTSVSFKSESDTLYSLEDIPDDEPEEMAGPDMIENLEDNYREDDTHDEYSAERGVAPEAGNGDTADADAENPMVVNVNEIDQNGKRHYKSQLDFEADHKYKFPPFDLMRPGTTKISVNAEEQLENKEQIKRTLLNFGIPIINIEATVGPTVTLYEIVPDKGVKIAKIRSLVDDIALRLAAKGVRIIAPIPGKGTVGIEVANKESQTVSMQTLIRSRKYQESHYNLPVALGSTISNEVYITDLTKMPHLLVAGATGQGKSVGLNAIIASLLYCKTPSQLKFVMIDPKQVEFSLYNKLKNHYLAVIPEDADSDEPVITDMDKVEATLSSLCIEMEDRYKLLKNAHVKNLEEYNTKIKDGKLNPADGHRFLPYIVVVVDEFGDLVMVKGKNVMLPIARLAQKARAVGMHVIIATQRPSTDVITGIIKANFPARMSFKVSSGVDSKTILDTTGAQQLIGRGDMLIFNNSEMVRVQCAFIDTPEVEDICDYIEKQPYAPGPYILPEPQMSNGEENGSGSQSFSERDPLFEEVAKRVVTSNTASTSSLQRVYSIGYNRAGKIMDQLEAAGIVGPSHGGKPRAVLVDAIGLDNILNSL